MRQFLPPAGPDGYVNEQGPAQAAQNPPRYPCRPFPRITLSLSRFEVHG